MPMGESLCFLLFVFMHLFQTMAVMEARAGRVEEARSLFSQATRTSQGSAATWLVSEGGREGVVEGVKE